jgi:hypothetical protein
MRLESETGQDGRPRVPRRDMKNLVFACFLACLLCSCSPLYYGYLPGTEYKMYKPESEIDLHGKTYNIQFIDNRSDITKINCSEYQMDRKTELEGEFGPKYFAQCLTAMIQNSNGRIDPKSENRITVGLEGLSFNLIGYVYVVAHGFVQFKVSSQTLNKTYCSDMTDHDDDAPLKWYSFVTRKTGSRLIVSGSVRRATENFVRELANANFP